MALERVERQGWFARLRSAVAGIVIGILLVGGAGVLQFWNEGRTLRQQQMLEAGRAEVVSIRASAASDYGNRLVHLSDELDAEGQLVDPEFNQLADGLGLRRKVEMFQWRERKETREETSVGGSKTTRTIYRYEQDWDDDLIDSSRFAEPEGHGNPQAMPFQGREWRAETVRLGGLDLAPAVINAVDGWRPMAVQSDRLPANLAATFSVDDGVLTTVSGSPRIGDLRVRFMRLPEGPLSVVARLSGNELQPDLRDQGSLLLVERGQHSAQVLFDRAESRNAGIGWMLRLAGFVVMWVGFGLVLAPLAVFADVIPAFGRLTRWLSALIGGVLSALISFVAIASGWLYHRPWLLGLLLIAIAAGLAWLLLRRKAQVQPPPPPAPAPPPVSGASA